MSKQVSELATIFENSPVAVLTGAGISTDSGIPDYRGAGSPPRTPMSIDQFTHDVDYRKRFWAGASVSAARTTGIAPNQGHRSLAALELADRLTGVITQNVDNLHREAGSHNLVELHGNGGMIRCVSCGMRWRRSEVLMWFRELNPGYVSSQLDAEIAPDGDAQVDHYASARIPPCPNCGGILRPDIVYFGETVPTLVFSRAEQLLADAGALLIAGSSLAVNTGIRLVHRAERRGIPIAVINRGPTAVDARATVRVEGGTSETLFELSQLLGIEVPSASNRPS